MKKLVSALIVAGTALALHAAVHEDDWLKVETPDKVVPDSGFQVKVTLKKDLGPSENVTVAMHTFKTDGGWMGTGEWRPPQTMKKGETKVFAFTAKGSDKVGHFGPLAFIAPNGDWGKATHKIFCGKITWAMSGAEAAKRKAEAEAAAARSKPPAGITYKKSWIVPRGCFKPGTDEPAKEIREGEPFDVVADYYLDPSEYWNNKCHIVVFGCGPWIDNPDGVHEKSSHHVNYPGAGWGFREVKPGKGTVRVTQTIKKFFRYNSLFFHVRFRGGDDKDFPWTKTCGAPCMVRPINGLDIVAPTAGGLFVAGREKPVVDLIAGADAKAGSPVAIKIFALDDVGKLEEVGSVSATMPDPGKTAKVDLSSAIGKRLGCFLAEGRSGDKSVDAFFGVIPDVDKALGGRRAPFGATDLHTDLECETAGLGRARPEPRRIQVRLAFQYDGPPGEARHQAVAHAHRCARVGAAAPCPLARIRAVPVRRRGMARVDPRDIAEVRQARLRHRVAQRDHSRKQELESDRRLQPLLRNRR